MSQTDELTQLFTRCCETQNKDFLDQVLTELQKGFTATEFEYLQQQILTTTVLALRQNYTGLSWFCEYILFSKTLPGVTKILEATALPAYSRTATKITRHEFELKKEKARQRGIAFHSAIRDYLTGRNNSCSSSLLPWIRSVEPVLCKLSYVRLLEKSVFHPKLLYSGKVDCVASYSGIDCVIEWKTAEKLEQSSLDEYIMQGVAYLDAINAIFGLSLEDLLIVVALPDRPAQTFLLDHQTLEPYRKTWYERLRIYRAPKQIIQNSDGSYFEIISPIYQDNSVVPPLIRYKGINFTSIKSNGNNPVIANDKDNTLDADDVYLSAPQQSSRTHRRVGIQSVRRDYTEDSIRLYLQEIGRFRLLRADEEIMFAQRVSDLLNLEYIRSRLANRLKREPSDSEWANEVNMTLPAFRHRLHLDRRAKDKMVQANLRLVVSIAKKYMNRGLSFQDLIQEGSLGLIRAAEKFDPTKGYKFSTYATWWIRQAMTRAIADQCRIIRLPVHISDTIARIRKTIKLLSRELGRQPSEGEVASHMAMTIEHLRFFLKSDQPVLCLDAPIEAEEDLWSGEQIDQDFLCLGNQLQAEEHPSEEDISDYLLREDLEGIVSTLSPREKDVLRLRYGLDDGRMKTLEEIGQIFNTPRERIRQIEAKVIRKLRHPNRNTVLREYIR